MDTDAAPALNRTLETSHQRVDSHSWDEIYVVGDVHGCRSELERLLDEIDPGVDELVIFVGDLVRKGPDSKGVLDLVRQQPNLVSVRGNNEQKFIDGRDLPSSLSKDDLSYMKSLPTAISWDSSLVVHGGVDHRVPLEEHDQTELLNMRSLTPDGSYDRPYWFEERRESPRVFFGHSVLAEPFETEWAVGLDTGCVYGGQLTAYRCSTGEFIAVEPGETHEERSSDSIIEPHSPKASNK